MGRVPGKRQLGPLLARTSTADRGGRLSRGYGRHICAGAVCGQVEGTGGGGATGVFTRLLRFPVGNTLDCVAVHPLQSARSSASGDGFATRKRGHAAQLSEPADDAVVDTIRGGSDAGPSPPVVFPEPGRCCLCGRGSTSSNRVEPGKTRKLVDLWPDARRTYLRIAPSLMCPEHSPDHSHCRYFLRAAHQAYTERGVGDPCVSLDVMARCYPLPLLDTFLAPDVDPSAHRRCRGGLLCLLRFVVQLAIGVGDGDGSHDPFAAAAHAVAAAKVRRFARPVTLNSTPPTGCTPHTVCDETSEVDVPWRRFARRSGA